MAGSIQGDSAFTYTDTTTGTSGTFDGFEGNGFESVYSDIASATAGQDEITDSVG